VREIGIRMALGATPSDVLQMVVADGMKPILLGVALGLATAFALSRVVTSLIYGVRATDPLTFAGVALLLVAVGLLATILPPIAPPASSPLRLCGKSNACSRHFACHPFISHTFLNPPPQS
jgi:putative ABC transport system permease protein